MFHETKSSMVYQTNLTYQIIFYNLNLYVLLFKNHFSLISINKQIRMEFLALLLMVYFVIGACVCLLICVNPNDPGILGRFNRIVFKKVPEIFSSIIRRIFGQRVLTFLGSIKHYLLQTNHPLVQIFYFIIAVVGFLLYVVYGIFRHMPSKNVADWQVILANMMALTCFWVYYKACSVEAGQVNKSNVKDLVQKYDKYYDEVHFKRNNTCKTCNIIKPARSKHCSICKKCVSKYDHHCIWIRQCVGERNYKYFVSFLFLHSIWCLYLSLIGSRSLIDYLQRINFWNMTFNIAGQNVKSHPLLALQFLFMSETIFFFLIVMCAIMGFTLFIFVSYHFYLISKGQTTNQRVKKNDDIQYYTKELKAISKLQKQFLDKDNKQVKQIQFRNEKVTKQELNDYKQQCKTRKDTLERDVNKKSFFERIDQVFKL